MEQAVLSGYAELHLHTNYSLLDGASHPEELIQRAVELGYRSLAITDHDNLFGAMVFARLCAEYGLQAVTGVELTLAGDPPGMEDLGEERHHLTLLAETREGYGNLCRLISLANGIEEPDPERREERRLDPHLPVSLLAGHCRGLICLTGCRQGAVPLLAGRGRLGEAEALLRRWVGWFGAENVFVELQDNLVFGDRHRNRALAELAGRVGVGTAATGDVHYHERSRHRLQDALVAVRHRSTLEESHRVRRPNSEFHLRSPEQQARRFREFPEAVRNTVLIAARCEFDLTQDLGYRLPEPPVPDGHTPDTWLAECCRLALVERYPTEEERVKAEARLEEELGLIQQHHLAGFFLVYKEVLDLARRVAAEVRGESARGRANLPPGRGRGSSVGSLVCHLIGLSHIDPIRNHLFLGRFLNEEMDSLPDIDLDFPRDIRERLIETVHERWGRDRAALVATIPRYRIRSAIRDLGKALGLPAVELDRLAKLSEGYGSSRALQEEMERTPQFRSLVDAPGWKELIELSWDAHDFPRHLSQHVGGMVISSDPLVECVPVQPAAWANRYVCHWDKDSIDDARMVKIDFLGLGMLSLVEECLDLIHSSRGELVDLSRISFDDERVFSRIQQGDTVGVFQIESRAQAQMLPRTRPQNLDDLTVQVAIVRPGPIVGGAVNPYVKAREARRAGRSFELDRSIHSTVKDVLEETLGVVLFQEQVVQVAMAMGGMSPGQAERFRRAMNRRDWERNASGFRESFIDGALAQNVPREMAEDMFRNLEGFASFGFPKSHAAAFGLLAYQSAWLKERYPVEFYCALYNNWPMGFYPPHVFTNDARRHDVEILGPDVNVSAAACTVEGEAVRIGLGYVHGLGGAGAEAVTEARDQGGLFRSLFDFVHRTGLGSEPVENLIRVGAFGELGLNRRELLWQLGLFGGGLRHRLRARAAPRQLRLALPTGQDQISLPDLTAYERMAADYEVMKLSPEDHPMSFQRTWLDLAGVSSSQDMRRLSPPQTVTTAGLVVCRQRPATAKGIIFLLLEDEHGLANVLVPRQLCEQERERMLVRTSAFLLIAGVLEGHAGAVPMLRATRIDPLQDRAMAQLRTPEGKSWG